MGLIGHAHGGCKALGLGDGGVCVRARLQVCAKAGLEPSAVSYIEAHGTGTVAGDGQELGALEEWYGRTGGR